MKNENLPAYPIGDCQVGLAQINQALSGVTKRELFAAMAMQGMLSNPDKSYNPEDLTQEAILHADCLLKQITHSQ